MNLRPYAEYRDSGLPWLGKIPAHWQILRNGGLFTHRVETGYPDLPILEVSLRTGVTIRDFGNTKRKQVMSQREKYKRARHGDIAYNMMRMWQGAVGVAPVDGLVSPAYVVVRPYAGTDTSYFNLLFGTQAYKAEVNKYSRGIVADRNRLYWDDFKQMSSIVPSLDEQSKIAAFLRTQDRQIAKLIRGKRRLIELLNEQKQTIIHRAVTRGLNSDVPLKPSGIDWLGDVPVHWDVCPLKAIGNIQFSGVDKHSHDDELPIRLCNYTDVYKNDFITSDMNFMVATATDAEIIRFRLVVGDVLLTKDSETPDDIGVPALVRSVPESGVVCGYHLAMIRPKAMIAIGEFIFRALSDRVVARQFHLAANGVTRFGLAKADVKRAVIPLPGLNEQKKICAHIAAEFAPINESIAATEREIALIREYRDRLISDVVTGQIDVRGWQPSADETSENEELIDMLADADEDGEIGEDNADDEHP